VYAVVRFELLEAIGKQRQHDYKWKLANWHHQRTLHDSTTRGNDGL